MADVHGVTSGPLAALLWTLYADTADYAEWKRGRRATGLIFSASIFSQKQGWAIGAWAAHALMQSVGFVANTAQTARSLHGLVLLMSVLPASLSIVSLLFALLYLLNEARVSRISSDLRARRALEAPQDAGWCPGRAGKRTRVPLWDFVNLHQSHARRVVHARQLR
jgi:GPH family glycoside/pentoside/hexuronide:cation symporter